MRIIQLTSVLQVRTLVEVSLERAAEETEIFLLQLAMPSSSLQGIVKRACLCSCIVRQFGGVALLNEEVLFMHDTVVRQDP